MKEYVRIYIKTKNWFVCLVFAHIWPFCAICLTKVDTALYIYSSCALLPHLRRGSCAPAFHIQRYDYQHHLDGQRLSLIQRTGELQNWQNLLNIIVREYGSTLYGVLPRMCNPKMSTCSRVQCLGSRVQGLEFSVQGLGSRIFIQTFWDQTFWNDCLYVGMAKMAAPTFHLQVMS